MAPAGWRISTLGLRAVRGIVVAIHGIACYRQPWLLLSINPGSLIVGRSLSGARVAPGATRCCGHLLKVTADAASDENNVSVLRDSSQVAATRFVLLIFCALRESTRARPEIYLCQRRISIKS